MTSRTSRLVAEGLPLGPADSSRDNPLITAVEDVPAQGAPSLAAIKAEWIRRRMAGLEGSFAAEEEFVVLVGSWNVDNTARPGSLEAWLRTAHVPDLVLVGLQEVDRRAEAYLYENPLAEELWGQAVVAGLNGAYPGVAYRRVAARLHVGLFACAFVREALAPLVSHVSTAVAPCGLMGVIANKGAVSLRLRLHSSYVCFVSAHLAAHIPAVQRRNQDVAEILRRTVFTDQAGRLDGERVVDALRREYGVAPGVSGIDDAATVIWAGDLNYRVAVEQPEALRLLAEGRLAELLAADQLGAERAAGRVFAGLHEAPIAFPPTFKYDPGTSLFDSSEKQRAPAWCDRVLFRGARSLLYESEASLVASDHKPVRSVLAVRARRIVPERFEAAYEAVLRQLDQYENAAIPVTQLNRHQVDVGTLVFRRLQTASVEILNVGQVICQFRVLPKLDAAGLACKPWVRLSPLHGLLEPGQSAPLRFSFYVDPDSAYNFNLDRDRVEDIVVVHVEGGRDHFIAVSGAFRKTPLCRMLADVSPCVGRRRKVAKPVWTLLDFIQRYGEEAVPTLFTLAGAQRDLDLVQDALDAGTDIPLSFDNTAVAVAAGQHLLRFLDCLPVPVVPYSFYRECLAAASNLEAARGLLRRLPEEHRLLFEYLVSFLGGWFLPRSAASMDTIEAAYIFAPLMLRSPDADAEPRPKELHQLALFLAQFLHQLRLQ